LEAFFKEAGLLLNTKKNWIKGINEKDPLNHYDNNDGYTHCFDQQYKMQRN